jgi:hypothetical protein
LFAKSFKAKDTSMLSAVEITNLPLGGGRAPRRPPPPPTRKDHENHKIVVFPVEICQIGLISAPSYCDDFCKMTGIWRICCSEFGEEETERRRKTPWPISRWFQNMPGNNKKSSMTIAGSTGLITINPWHNLTWFCRSLHP